MLKRKIALVGLLIAGIPLAGCVVEPAHHHRPPPGYYDRHDRDGDRDGRHHRDHDRDRYDDRRYDDGRHW